MLTTDPFDLTGDTLREECGIFGIMGHPEAAAMTALGLHALQHRGQEACGIVSHDGEQFYVHRANGLVGDAFSSQAVVGQLKGNAAIGHDRYATTGGAGLRNVQPLFADFEFGGFAISHNGNLTNAGRLRHQLVSRGCLFQSTSDTEVFLHLMATARGGNVIDRLVEAMRQVEGAYSLIALSSEHVIGIRDPMGFRPMVLGKLETASGTSHVLASETCALDIIDAEFIRDVEPGEMVVLSADGVTSIKPFQPAERRFCIFEYIYFARPDSVVEGTSVYEARRRIGAELAVESPVEADVIIPVPDSGVPSAIGFAAQSGVPFELGIIRNHYVGRTFIEPTDQIRHLGVRLKHNANRAMIEGRRVVLVDDSIVRGTTSQKIVKMVRAAGAKEVHMRISSPPTTNPCFYGVDTPEKSKLLAHNYSVQQMAELIGVDSLAFISIDGLYRAMGAPKRAGNARQFCDACFTGDYPTPLTDHTAAPRRSSALSERV